METEEYPSVAMEKFDSEEKEDPQDSAPQTSPLIPQNEDLILRFLLFRNLRFPLRNSQ